MAVVLSLPEGEAAEGLSGNRGRSLPVYFACKQAFDRMIAMLLLLPGLPIMGFLVLLIKATSRGPGVYSQQRVGRNGCVYTMYKLRSMRIDAETKTGPVWSPAGRDSRVTPLGYWLRKLHLDELPQLFNVLRGEMSLIGPRPERPEFVEILAASIPGYLDRLQVAPGITGLAQINLPPDTNLDDVRRKLVLDQQYIASAGPLLDARILCSTLLRLCGLRGEWTIQLMSLKRTVELPPPATNAAELPTSIVVALSAPPFASPEQIAPSEVEAFAHTSLNMPCDASPACSPASMATG